MNLQVRLSEGVPGRVVRGDGFDYNRFAWVAGIGRRSVTGA
jgi:hypothetical protein